MSTDLATRPELDAKIVEMVLAAGDLKGLQPAQRVAYYRSICDSLGLNPLTKPFEYITLNGKLTLYARRDCTDQLRSLRHVNIAIVARESIGDCYIVTAKATMPSGRCDESIGVMSIKGLTGEALANAIMKAETKAKRRVTLSICGLGIADESEIESTPDAVVVDMENGDVQPTGKSATQNLAAKLKEQFPDSKHGTVKETDKPGTSPQQEATEPPDTRPDWMQKLGSNKAVVKYCLAGVKKALANPEPAAGLNITAKISESISPATIGQEGYTEVMQAITAAERKLQKGDTEEVAEPFGEEEFSHVAALVVLIKDAQSTLDIDLMIQNWKADKESVTEGQYKNGLAMLEQARKRFATWETPCHQSTN